MKRLKPGEFSKIMQLRIGWFSYVERMRVRVSFNVAEVSRDPNNHKELAFPPHRKHSCMSAKLKQVTLYQHWLQAHLNDFFPL